MDKYYTPDITEFVQGFKFEKLKRKSGEKIGSIIYINSIDVPEINIVSEHDVWIEITVFWKREPEMKTIVYDNGMSLSYMEYPEWDWYPWNKDSYIIDLIKNGKIRAKR